MRSDDDILDRLEKACIDFILPLRHAKPVQYDHLTDLCTVLANAFRIYPDGMVSKRLMAMCITLLADLTGVAGFYKEQESQPVWDAYWQLEEVILSQLKPGESRAEATR
jgi:hypothetical protein